MVLRSTGSEALDKLALTHLKAFCTDADCWCKDPDSYDVES